MGKGVMKKEDANCPKNNSEDQGFYTEALTKSKKNEVSAEEVDSDSKRKDQKTLPDWIVAIASCVLVIITAIYAYYTYRLVVLTRNTLETTTEAIRLEQRPWVGYYGYAIEARENPNAVWVKREPTAGEEFRVSFSIKNVGRTPALKLQLASIVGVVSIEAGDFPSAPNEWVVGTSKNVVFPESEGFTQYSGRFKLMDQDFLEYSTAKKELYFWARLYYCDGIGKRYWTQIGVSHVFGESLYSIRSSSVGSDSGEANHPDCED